MNVYIGIVAVALIGFFCWAVYLQKSGRLEGDFSIANLFKATFKSSKQQTHVRITDVNGHIGDITARNSTDGSVVVSRTRKTRGNLLAETVSASSKKKPRRRNS